MTNEIQIVKEPGEKLMKWVDVETEDGYLQTALASAEVERPSAEDMPPAEKSFFGIWYVLRKTSFY